MGGTVLGAAAVMAEQCTGRGARGVVVAAAPQAASAGATVLAEGGNAYDAVVAAALAECVLLPPKCGLAGDLVALRIRPGASSPEALLAIGPAPRRLAAAVRERGELPETGPLSVGVPGAPAGYAALAEGGRLPRPRLAAPAIELARAGFAWAPICALLGEESAAIVRAGTPAGCRYYPDGRPLRAGDLIRLPGLASVIEAWVDLGAELFGGDLGAVVAGFVAASGGVLDTEDLVTAQAQWTAADRLQVAGWDVWATPAPTHGPSLLDALSGWNATWTTADVLTAVRAATARRTGSAGDPLVAAGTSMVSAVDADGNVVTVVHSNSYPRFGSGLVVDELDLILANRAGRGFTAVDGHPNFPEPGRRPVTTLHAWAAGPFGTGPVLAGGTPGGENQLPWNAQAIHEVLGGCIAPGELVTNPRWEWLPAESQIRAEEGLSDAELGALVDAGGEVLRVPMWGLRSAQQVVRRPEHGRVVVGAVDPRTGGLALGV
jgi:gamma-glutamyltranspeptidase/glutathione hydrolase